MKLLNILESQLSEGIETLTEYYQTKDAQDAWNHLSKKYKVKRSKSRKRRYLDPAA